jgi:hypothetical protein
MKTTEDMCQEIENDLNHLLAISNSLREAMLARDSERILEVVARADGWSPSLALQTAAPDVLKNERVSKLARKLQRVQESNRLLSNAFIKLYQSVLQSTTEMSRGVVNVYGRAGRTEPKAAGPMLINQTG